jgi:hypothetical protein
MESDAFGRSLLPTPPRKRGRPDVSAAYGTPDLNSGVTDGSDSKRRRGGSGGGVIREKPNKGLRHFSLQVCQKVKDKGKTTYGEVADELVHESSQGIEGTVDEKNIRRRVYDALNVFTALHIISKEKKDIQWRGLPAEFHKEFDTLSREKKELEARIRDRQREIRDLEIHQESLRRLYQRNREPPYSSSSEEERVFLPFIILSTQKDCNIKLDMTDCRDELHFEFDQPFQLHDDMELLRLLHFWEDGSGTEEGSYDAVTDDVDSRRSDGRDQADLDDEDEDRDDEDVDDDEDGRS